MGKSRCKSGGKPRRHRKVPLSVIFGTKLSKRKRLKKWKILKKKKTHRKKTKTRRKRKTRRKKRMKGGS